MDLALLNAQNLATLLYFSWHPRVRGSYGYIKGEVPYKEYVFGLKPNSLSVHKPKIFGKKVDMSGIIVEHWINDLQAFDFKGTTGSLEPLYPEMTNLKSSAVYQWFYQLDMFIQRHNQDILMSYEDFKYWGFFADFGYEEDADNPYTINYSFNFTVYPYDGGFKLVDSATPDASDSNNVIEASIGGKPQIMKFGQDTWYENLYRTYLGNGNTRGALSITDLWNHAGLGAANFKKGIDQGAIRTDRDVEQKLIKTPPKLQKPVTYYD